MKIFSLIIQYSMRNRFLTLALSVAVACFGFYSASKLPVDILPPLDKSMVTIVTEAPGMAPEEIETLVNIPLETALGGLNSVTRMRASASPSLSLVNIEFGWNADIYKVRQLIQERLRGVELPEGVTPIIAPISSVMGEIMVIGVWSPKGSMSPLQLRTLAERDIARRLMNIRGVSQVLATGGGLKQYRIIPDTRKMAALSVSFEELSEAAKNAQSNTGGGIAQDGGVELLVRNTGRSASIEDLSDAVVKTFDGAPVRIKDVANVRIDRAQLRGDAAINGISGVILTVQKQPDADTLSITKAVESALGGISKSLGKDVEIKILYRQDGFINAAVSNVASAVRDGAIMVVAVLFLFLFNVRTTLVTVTAIPLSFGAAMLWFALVGEPVNTMLLGGLAVAVGMLVDDAIVDVENAHRRLAENALSAKPRSKFAVILDACVEIRASIFYATAIIMIVFLPTLGLEGMEGKMFKPLAAAVVVSMAASFIVALTAIPALCSLLLGGENFAKGVRDSFVSRIFKKLALVLLIAPSTRFPRSALLLSGLAVAAAFALFPIMGRDFLPKFNEGSSLLIVQIAADSSIERSNEIGAIIDRRIAEIPEAKIIGRKIGRAEKDDHAEPVNVIKFNIEYEKSARTSAQILANLRGKLDKIAGTSYVITQPMAHRIDYMLSGTQSNIAVKIFGDDLGELKHKADELAEMVSKLEGASDVSVEKQQPTLQLRVQVDRKKAALYGVQVGKINAILNSALAGKAVSQVLDEGVLYDVFVRADENLPKLDEKVGALLIENSEGRKFPLSSFAKVYYAKGPNQINRENQMRRIVLSVNSAGGDSVALAAQIRNLIDAKLNLKTGYYAKIEGQFQNRIDAGRRMGILFGVSMLLILALLYTHFKSLNLSLQILAAVPTAFAGGLFLTWWLIGTMSVASLIGMVALAGIAARNTIMLVSHYLHLSAFEGENFGTALVERGTLERLNPILMTALTAAFALIPILWNPTAEGNELLYPVSVMIVGGLVSSTFLSLVITPALFAMFGAKVCLKVKKENI